MTKLYWVADVGKLLAESAFSGRVCVGGVMKRSGSDKWTYEIEAIHLGDIAEHTGEAESKAEAQAAVELAWSDWCQAAGLWSRL